MRHRQLLVLALAGTVVASLAAVPAAAEEPVATRLTVGLQTSAMENLSDYATATLLTADGAPIGDAEVQFRIQVDLLGGRLAALGSAVTDAAGVARIPIVARTDAHQVQAVYAGDERHQPSDAAGILRFSPERIRPVVAEAPPSRLATLRSVMPRVLGIVVAVLWLFFMGATFYVVHSVRHAGGRTETDTRAITNGGG